MPANTMQKPGHFPTVPLQGTRLALMTLGVALVTFMQVLDTTIANVAISTIAGDLGTSTAQGTWVITSFSVANAISVPITSWLAKRCGEIRLFLGAIILFAILSFLCGLAPNIEWLILLRILQGVSAGPMAPLSQSILLTHYPPEKKPLALSLWSMVIVVAPICGPLLGGWICNNYHWSWIFYINIPIAIIALTLCVRLLPKKIPIKQKNPINFIGLGLLFIGVGSLQFVLDCGRELDWFNSGKVIVLSIIAIICLIMLVIWESYEAYPILDLRLFKNQNFTVGITVLSLGYMNYFGFVLLLPLLLQSILGYTALHAGMAAAPIGILPIILTPLLGKNASRIDLRWLTTISFSIFALCLFWRSQFNLAMDFRFIAWPQFIQGIGLAMFSVPLTAIAFSQLSLDQITSASTLSSFIRSLSASIGASLTATLWDSRQALHYTQLSANMNSYNPTAIERLQQLQSLGVSKKQAMEYTAIMIKKESQILAATELFWAMACCYLILIVFVWFAKPPFTLTNHPSNDNGD